MYICKEINNSEHKFIKCQTFKPYMLNSGDFDNYIDETPDINRNPFKTTTRIDCDKIFVTYHVFYGDELKTTRRTNICRVLFYDICNKIQENKCKTIFLNDEEVVTINEKTRLLK